MIENQDALIADVLKNYSLLLEDYGVHKDYNQIVELNFLSEQEFDSLSQIYNIKKCETKDDVYDQVSALINPALFLINLSESPRQSIFELFSLIRGRNARSHDIVLRLGYNVDEDFFETAKKSFGQVSKFFTNRLLMKDTLLITPRQEKPCFS
jgi:hypothetical protein